jgi:hypothetical protein
MPDGAPIEWMGIAEMLAAFRNALRVRRTPGDRSRPAAPATKPSRQDPLTPSRVC